MKKTKNVVKKPKRSKRRRNVFAKLKKLKTPRQLLRKRNKTVAGRKPKMRPTFCQLKIR